MPSVTVPTPGIEIGNQPEQHAQHHAKSQRDVAEFCGRLYGIAEMPSHLFLPVRWHQHADAIAEFKRQVGRRHEVGIVPPHVQQMYGKAGRQRKAGQRHAHYVGFADKDANIVQGRTILDDPARFQPPQPRGCFRNGVLALCDDHKPIAG